MEEASLPLASTPLAQNGTMHNQNTIVSQTQDWAPEDDVTTLETQLPAVAAAVPASTDSEEIEETSPLNGAGMWTAWLRSFSTPLLAMQDLFDNAVDASFTMQHQLPDVKPKIHIHLDEIGQGGIVLRNSCLHEIPPMRQVLTVYESHKTGDAVGENGIGIKHACANLSTLSFILTKTADYYSIGILMEDLQRQDGALFPSCQFRVEDDLQQALIKKCRRQARTWGKALAQYGENDVEVGIDRLLTHFEGMRTGVWRGCDNVFTVLLTQLRHTSLGEQDDDELHDGMNEMDNMQERSLQLLGDLRDQLPRLYIHIQSLEVVVQHQVIDLLYWEKRLVDVTKFEVAINQSTPWAKDDNHLESAQPPYAGKSPTVRFFVGFDPYRSSERRHSAVKWCLYSRASGRLITENQDARSKFHLVSGSTDFKQGLTILLDDYNSTLPLNPTKQDFAYPHKTHGLIHEANVVEWSAAITHFYWQYHYEKLGCSKAVLSQAVLQSIQSLKNLHEGDSPTAVPPLSRSQYITFPALQWKSGHGKIRTTKREREAATALLGGDSRVRLTVPPPVAPARKRKQSARKTIREQPYARASPKRPRAGHGEESKYNEFGMGFDDDDDDDDDDEDEYDGAAVSARGASLQKGFSKHFPNQGAVRDYMKDRKRLLTLEKELKEKQSTIQVQNNQIEQLQSKSSQYHAEAERNRQNYEELKKKLQKKKLSNYKLQEELGKATDAVKQKERQLLLQGQGQNGESPNAIKASPSSPMGSPPSTPNDTEKMRRLLRQAREQSKMFQETADRKQSRIELMQEEHKGLESENRLLRDQLKLLQEYQEEEI